MKKTRIITFIIAVLFFGVAFAQSHSANECRQGPDGRDGKIAEAGNCGFNPSC